jgi:UDP-N-acetylglucosamine 2-epimerase
MLVSEGISQERVIVTGSPKFDKLFYSKQDSCKDNVCREHDIRPDKDIIILFTEYQVESGEWTPEQRRMFVLAIAEAAARLPDAQLIIKLHPPYEKEEDYNEIIKEITPRPIVCKYANLPQLINACSLAIAFSSTTALESMAAERSVLLVDLFNEGPSIYQDSGALFANSADQVLPMMQKALYDPQTKAKMKEMNSKFVFDQAFLQDGQASRRIASLIKDMASQGAARG